MPGPHLPGASGHSYCLSNEPKQRKSGTPATCRCAAGLCLDYHTPPLPCSTAKPTQKGTAGLTHSKLPARLHQPLLRVGTIPHNQGTCAPVEAGHDGRRVDDVRHAAAAQRLQVARRADRACRAAHALLSTGLVAAWTGPQSPPPGTGWACLWIGPALAALACGLPSTGCACL